MVSVSFRSSIADIWNEKDENGAEEKSHTWKSECQLTVSVQQKSDKVWSENTAEPAEH